MIKKWYNEGMKQRTEIPYSELYSSSLSVFPLRAGYTLHAISFFLPKSHCREIFILFHVCNNSLSFRSDIYDETRTLICKQKLFW